MARRLSNYLVAFAFAAAAAAECEVLRSLEFQQHTAPKGVSELLGPVVSLVSEKAAEVGDIKIRWDGELGLHRVGTHKIVAEVGLAPRVHARGRHAGVVPGLPEDAHDHDARAADVRRRRRPARGD
jgi:hypothetical protein